ncbi:MAG: hypothetical protein M4579_005895 [Chaenotheca gracillima]|nr:MAG: hypothetical protein M4579_005895 [Chaenotheca gracillima]
MTGMLSLPEDIIEEIALLLSNDKDVVNLASTCKTIWRVIHLPTSFVWRQKFKLSYDPTRAAQEEGAQRSRIIPPLYKSRQRALHKTLRFKLGFRPHEVVALSLLRTLLVESNGVENEQTGIVNGRNLELIRHYAFEKSDMIMWQRIRGYGGPAPSALLLVIQVMLAFLFLDPVQPVAFDLFAKSQAAVYQSPFTHNLFNINHPGGVDLGLVNHMLNFFKYHMKNAHSGELFGQLIETEPSSRPHVWAGLLSQGSHDVGDISLPRVWLGASASLHQDELRAIRSDHQEEGKVYSDRFSEELEEMHLRIADTNHQTPEALLMANYLQLYTPIGSTYARVAGSGVDDREFLLEGRIFSLPPQELVYGWYRIILVRWYPQDHFALGSVYEGVISPGNQIMMGKWWEQRNEHPDTWESGPWILWARSQRATNDVANAWHLP